MTATASYRSRTEDLSDFVRQTWPGSKTPLVITIPHSGQNYDGVGHHLDLRPAVWSTLYAGVDHSVPRVTQIHERDDVYLIQTQLARAIVDVNRGRDDHDRHSVEGSSTEPKSQGIIWNATIAPTPEGIERMLTHPYSRQEFERLMRAAYDPFVDAVKKSMAEAYERCGHAVLFDIHSIWPNETSTVKGGIFDGAYLVGKPFDQELVEQGKIPHLYLMTSKDADGRNISCSPFLLEFIVNHFKEYSLVVQQREVASPRFELAHRKYARLPEYEVFSMEIVGHNGLERGRAQGRIIFDPEPEYLKLLQDAFEAFLIGLRDLEFMKVHS